LSFNQPYLYVMKTKLTLFFLLVLLTNLSFAQKDPVYNSKEGAIEGYDPVAYFNDAKAVKGLEDFTYDWNNTKWLFASAKNQKAFMENPEKYAPQFGGYCAYAVSQGYTYKSDPEAWKIVDGKLYLNFSIKIQEKWVKDQANLIKLGEANWPKVIEN
jgi:YHS domain-containing protein